MGDIRRMKTIQFDSGAVTEKNIGGALPAAANRGSEWGKVWGGVSSPQQSSLGHHELP